MLIRISDQEVTLGEELITIIQGNYLKGKISGIGAINWLDYLNEDVFKNGTLNEEIIKKILTKISKNNKKILDVQVKLNSVSKIINSGNYFKKNQFIFEELNTIMNSLINFSKISLRKINLEKELIWSKFFEDESKNSMNFERIESLKNQINIHSKELEDIEPEFRFLKKRINDYNERQEILKEENSRKNKEYRIKTSENNKLSREMDKIVPKYEIYSQKLEEIKNDIDPDINPENNDDFIRIGNKRKTVEEKIKNLKNSKYMISSDLKVLKQKILKNKETIKELGIQINDLKPRYKKIDISYSDSITQLEDKKGELEKLRNGILNSNIKGDNKDRFPEGKKPETIRYSEIVKSELLELEESRNRLLESMGIENMEQASLAVLKKTGKIMHDNDSLIDAIRTERENLNDIIIFFEDFRKMAKNFEIQVNSIMKMAGLNLEILKIPVIFEKDYENESIIDKLGIKFTIFDEKQKPVIFDDLVNQKKLLLLLSIMISLNLMDNKNESIFFDVDYDPKQMTKGNMNKTIKTLKDTVKKHKIVFFCSKNHFKEAEIEGIGIISIDH